MGLIILPKRGEFQSYLRSRCVVGDGERERELSAKLSSRHGQNCSSGSRRRRRRNIAETNQPAGFTGPVFGPPIPPSPRAARPASGDPPIFPICC